MIGQPELTVVIPTYNRCDILREALEALAAQDVDTARFDVVVVDDGSTDGTQEMLQSIEAGGRLQLDTVRQEHKLAGSARNAGIERARGVCVLLLDSDMIASTNLVARHLSIHTRYADETVAMLGRVLTGDRGVDLVGPDNRRVPVTGRMAGGEPLVPVDMLTTQNVSLKKAVLQRVGSFTPGLPCLQDKELAFRLKRTGVRLVYDHEAAAVHTAPRDTFEKVVASGKKYGRTLAEWQNRLPVLREEITNLGARFGGGWREDMREPLQAIKNAARRVLINRWTGPLLEKGAGHVRISNPPSRLAVRLGKELWAFHYRNEYRKYRRQNAGDTSGS